MSKGFDLRGWARSILQAIRRGSGEPVPEHPHGPATLGTGDERRTEYSAVIDAPARSVQRTDAPSPP